MKLGACVPLEYYSSLVEYGYSSIALAAKDVAAWNEAELESARQLLSSGPLERISLNNFCPATLRMHGPGYSPEAVLRYTQTVLQRGQLLGFRYLGLGAPTSRNLLDGENAEEAMVQFRQLLGALCDLAEEYGMEILLGNL